MNARRRFWFARRTAALSFALCAGVLASCSRTPLLNPRPDDPCLPLDPRGPSTRLVSADIELLRADVLFLVDNSSSMADEIDRIREQLRDVLAPQLRARLPDTDMGLAVFSDFGEYMVGQDSHPYQLLQEMTDDVDRVRKAAGGIELEYGGDDPESQLEAMYQAATGKGYGAYIKAKKDCPAGTHGGVCLRKGSFPIVLLFTDAPMRNVTGLQADGSLSPDDTFNPLKSPGAPYIPYVRTYEETLSALEKENMRVVGLWSGGDGDGIDDMRRVARDSGAVDADGQPIVFDIGGAGELLGTGVVQSVETLVSAVQISLRLELLDGDPLDGFDPRALVTSVRPVRAEPAGSAQIEGSRFTHVSTGTTVWFEVSFDTSTVPLADVDQRYPLELRIEDDRGTLLSDQMVDVIVQAEAACPTP